MRIPRNRTTVIIVGLALAASIAIGGVLGEFSGDGDEPEGTRPALSAPTTTPGTGTDEAATPTVEPPTAPISTPTASSASPVATLATPTSPASSPQATPEE